MTIYKLSINKVLAIIHKSLSKFNNKGVSHYKG